MALKDLAICPEPGAIEAIQRAYGRCAGYRPFDAKEFYKLLIKEGYDVVADLPPSTKNWRKVEELLVDALKIVQK